MFGFYDFLIWSLLIIIGLIIFFIWRKRKSKEIRKKDWYLQFSLSKEDRVSQFLFLFSIFFLGITFLAFNKDMGDPISWRTILLLVSVIGLIIAYYFKVIYTLAISLIGISVWWEVQALAWAEGKYIKGIAFLTGLLFITILFYIIGHVHEKKIESRRASIVYTILGLAPATVIFFLFSTKYGLKTLEGMTKGASIFTSLEITMSFLIFLITLIGILAYFLNKKLILKSEVLAIGILSILFSIIVLIPEQNIFLQQQTRYGIYKSVNLSNVGALWAAIFNVLVLCETLSLFLLGYFKKERWIKNGGLLLTGLLLFVKFVEWVDNSAGHDLVNFIGIIIFLASTLSIYLLPVSLVKDFRRKIWYKIYSFLGIIPVTFLLFWLSSKTGLRATSFSVFSNPSFIYLVILATIYLMFNIGILVYFSRKKEDFVKEMTPLIVISTFLILFIFVLPHDDLFLNRNTLNNIGIVWAIFFNILIFSEIIGVIFLGYLKRENWFINVGVIFIFLLIFVKYFDWFFTSLDKSVFFIGAGILLFVVGWFMEKGRRYMLSTIVREGSIRQDQ